MSLSFIASWITCSYFMLTLLEYVFAYCGTLNNGLLWTLWEQLTPHLTQSSFKTSLRRVEFKLNYSNGKCCYFVRRERKIDNLLHIFPLCMNRTILPLVKVQETLSLRKNIIEIFEISTKLFLIFSSFLDPRIIAIAIFHSFSLSFVVQQWWGLGEDESEYT